MAPIPRWTARAQLPACILWLAGCAQVNPTPDYDRAGAQTEAVVGQPVTFRPGDAANVRTMVAKLLEDGLTADEAVQITLLNNPKVWAAFAGLGIARADVVQAGLLSNPSLGLSSRLPEGGGLSDFELSLAQNIADVWMIPARKRAAQRDLDRAILDAAREIAGLALDTKVAYFNAIATERSLAIARENLSLVQELLKIAEARQQAGAVGALDVNLVRGLVLKAEIELRTARLEGATARRTLATLLGLDRSIESLVLTDALPTPQDMPLEEEQLLAIAADARLDLRSARHAVLAAQARVEAEYARVFQDVEVAFELERNASRALPDRKILADTARATVASGQLTAPEIESRAQRQRARSQEIEAILGPSLSVTLPIFDQNQAQIAKAGFAYHQAQAQLDALSRSVAQETREALDRAKTDWGMARLYETEALPQARRTLELSEAAYRAGSAAILTVIDAQRSLLETQRSYVAALQSAATALVDLERATARPMSALLSSAAASRPSGSQPIQGAPSTRPNEGSK